MKITAFKPIKDYDGKEIGGELLYPNVLPVQDVREATNNFDWEE